MYVECRRYSLQLTGICPILNVLSVRLGSVCCVGLFMCLLLDSTGIVSAIDQEVVVGLSTLDSTIIESSFWRIFLQSKINFFS